MRENISFIGLGSMGTPMARNLLQEGFPLWVYNRSSNKTDELVKEGAHLLHYPGEALEKASFVITMLSNDQALEDIIFGSNGLGEKLKKGTTHISMSSISPKMSKQLTEYHHEKGADFIAAPVFGRPNAASAKKLWILVAGSADGKKKVHPILESMGQKIFDFGEEPEKVSLIKLAGNFLILSAIEAMGEAFTLLEKSGIDSSQVAKALQNLFFPVLFIKDTVKRLRKNSMNLVDLVLS